MYVHWVWEQVIKLHGAYIDCAVCSKYYIKLRGVISMITYECEDCGVVIEIEGSETVSGRNEAYEFNQCQACFKSDK